MIQWAGFLINAGLLLLGVVGAAYKIGQMKGVQEQQEKRIKWLENRYNGVDWATKASKES